MTVKRNIISINEDAYKYVEKQVMEGKNGFLKVVEIKCSVTDALNELNN